jgi:hypothetical protein
MVILSNGGIEGMGKRGAKGDVIICFKDDLAIFFVRFFVIIGGVKGGLFTPVDTGGKYTSGEG